MKNTNIIGTHMQQIIGELIQQQRRLRHLTQAELGGNQFSKSYVSAIERGKVHISLEILRFFAEKLELSENYFLDAVAATQEKESSPYRADVSYPTSENQLTQNEILSKLETIKELDDYYQISIPGRSLTLSTGVIDLLPIVKRAGFYILKGKLAQEKNELATALRSFELAQALAPAEIQPVILDYLGQNYALSKAYQTARKYHQQALELVSSSTEKEPTRFLFLLKMHCGDDDYALGNYEGAFQAYEQASQHLSLIPEVNISSRLYWRMGHCLSLTTNWCASNAFITHHPFSVEKLEQDYKQARDLLSQSIILHRVCRDRMGENKARLTLAQTLLDQHYWYHLLSLQSPHSASPDSQSFSSEEIEEQCYQILQNNQAMAEQHPHTSDENMDMGLLALAYVIRVHIQCARQDCNHKERDDTARLHLQKSLALYQKVLADPQPSWHMIRQVLQTRTVDIKETILTLPMLPDPIESAEQILPHAAVGLLEIYIAMAEAAEVLRVFSMDEYLQRASHKRANEFLEVAHTLAELEATKNFRGIHAAFRFYQRSIVLFEKRREQDNAEEKETGGLFLDILRSSFEYLQKPIILQGES